MTENTDYGEARLASYRRAAIQVAARNLAEELRGDLHLDGDQWETLALAVEHRILDLIRDSYR